MANRRCFDPLEDRAIVEVGKVLSAVSKHGAYSSVVFDESVTMAVIARHYGGWVRLCAECDSQGFRREFVRAWAAYCRQGLRQTGHLPGIFETTDRANGYHEHVQPPKLIGDPDKARAVLNALPRETI